MQVRLSPDIRYDAELSQMVEAAVLAMEHVIGPAADDIKAAWTLSRATPVGLLVHVTLEDANGVCGMSFTPEDLEDVDRLMSRCEELWEDLLEQGPKSGVFRMSVPIA